MLYVTIFLNVVAKGGTVRWNWHITPDVCLATSWLHNLIYNVYIILLGTVENSGMHLWVDIRDYRRPLRVTGEDGTVLLNTSQAIGWAAQ
jgi:hypothetical protein